MCECANRTALCIASCASVGKTILFLPRFVNNRTLQQTTYAMSKDTADANATCTFCLIQPNCTKNAFINTENDIINAFSRKSLLFLLLYFCKTKTSTTKKRNLLFAVFYIGKNIFPRFVFDFLHCNLPFCTRGLAEVFLLQIVCLGKGQARHLNNTLHRPSDKNHYCKNCFCMLCTSDKIAFSVSTVKPA